MAFVRTALCAAFMVTVVMSKPVWVSEGEDSSKSSESSESDSSEEIDAPGGPSQELLPSASTETGVPNATEETDPRLPSADEGPSAAMPDPSALPDPEDPQTSADTDPLRLVPDDPSHTALGTDVSQDVPDSDPSQDSVNADTVHIPPDPEGSLHPGRKETDTIIAVGGTSQPGVTTVTASLRFPQGVTPPFPLHIITPTPLQFSTAPPLPIAMGPVLTGVPVCFTFQFTTPEPDPPRGDSM